LHAVQARGTCSFTSSHSPFAPLRWP
jgi:hypothetical protein